MCLRANLYGVMTHLLACESDLLYYYMYMYCIKSCWRPQQRAQGRIFDVSHGDERRFKQMLLLLRGCWVLRRKPKNLKGTHPNTDTGRTRRLHAERPGIKPSGATVLTTAPPCGPAHFLGNKTHRTESKMMPYRQYCEFSGL